MTEIQQGLLWRALLLLGMGCGFIGGTGCGESKSDSAVVYETKEITDFPDEVRLPSVLWDVLEQKKMIQGQDRAVENPQVSNRFEENVFSGITLRLTEKTKGVLGGKNIELKALKSGLLVDFAQFVKMSQGTLILSFEPESVIDPASAQVLFLSRSIERIADKQILGGGCHRFYDVTAFYLSHLLKTGLEVNVTDGRHVSLLAGTFFIRVSHEKSVRTLTQITFRDSRRPDLQCDEI